MKTNFSVNIGGRNFNIDEDAYQILTAYLDGLRMHFSNETGAEEILEDIESRISDLFAQYQNEAQLTISLVQVNQVINEMGQPQDWDDAGQKSQDYRATAKTEKRMYRDPDRRMIAGVASGIAAWARIDPVWVRLAFVLISFFYFSGVLFYLVLWFVIPEAQSMSDRLEMHGQEVNVENLMKRFRQEKKRFQNNNPAAFTNLISSFFSVLGRILLFVLKLLGRLVGIILLLLVIGWSVGLTVLMLIQDDFQMGSYMLFDASFVDLIMMTIPNSALRWELYFTAGLTIISLFGLMTYAGLKLLIGWKHNTRQIPLVLTVLLVAGAFSTAMLVFKFQEAFSHNGAEHHIQTLVVKSPDSVSIQMQRRLNAEYINFPGRSLSPDVTRLPEGRFFHSIPSISIRPSDGDSLYVEFLTSARGISEEEARILSKTILYNWQYSEYELKLDRYFSVPLSDTYHRQELDIIVYIPESTRIFLNDEAVGKISWRNFTGDFNREEGWFTISRQGLSQIKSDSIPE